MVRFENRRDKAMVNDRSRCQKVKRLERKRRKSNWINRVLHFRPQTTNVKIKDGRNTRQWQQYT